MGRGAGGVGAGAPQAGGGPPQAGGGAGRAGAGAGAGGAGGRKLRILALHGYLQSGPVFRSRTGSLRKKLKSSCEFVFAEGPHEVAQPGGGDVRSCGGGGEEEAKRAWWLAPAEENQLRPRDTSTCVGVEASLQALEQVLRDEGPFDGVLGFSQGGAAAAILCAAIQTEQIAAPQFRFGLFFGAFAPRDPSYSAFIKSAGLNLPSLHFYGEADNLVTEDRTSELHGFFDGGAALMVSHPQGHCIPSLAEVRNRVKEFVSVYQNAQ